MDAHTGLQPSPWVVRFCALIAPASSVLDLACGYGRHARLLSSLGHRVTAVDRDPQALGALAGLANVACVNADLEGAPWPFAPAQFDAVIVTSYLHRPLFGAIAASLRGGGALIYETFMAGNERFGRPSNPDYLLRPHELLEAFAALDVVAFEQGVEQVPAPRAVQRIAALARGGGERVFPLPAARQID